MDLTVVDFQGLNLSELVQEGVMTDYRDCCSESSGFIITENFLSSWVTEPLKEDPVP